MIAVTTPDNEFAIDLDKDTEIGPMIVLDPRVLIDDPLGLLWLGDTNEFDAHWWLVSDLPTVTTQEVLDPVFSQFVRDQCMAIEVDADAYYYGADDDRRSSGFGYEDAYYMYTFHVYCAGSPKSNVVELLCSLTGVHKPDNIPGDIFDWLKTCQPSGHPRHYVIVDRDDNGQAVVRGFEL